MNGWIGRSLRINLTDGKSLVEELDVETLDKFLGGRGLGVKVITDEVSPDTDPLSPDNKIVFTSGPLVGTGAITGASCNAVTKSPLNNGLACAKMRGHFGAELKFAGFDMLIIEGRAESPVVLTIMDNRVRLLPAFEYWGRTTSETEALFKKSLPDQWTARETFMACIGQAGENLLPIANIVNNGFLSVGGAGIGAVMGAKNLKAIAVKGRHSLKVADGSKFVQTVNTLINKLDSAPLTGQSMTQWGTAFLVGLCYPKGVMPQNNFRRGTLSLKNIGTEALDSAFALKGSGCFACPVACIKKTELKHPGFQGRGMVPTYLALGSLGTNCGINDLSAIGSASMMCADFGLDPIAIGGTLATAMELIEKKALSPEELKIDIRFGNAETMLEAIKLIATKKGYLKRLGQGGMALAESAESPETFMGVRGISMSPFDPRAIQGMGLHYATCNYGPHHLYGYTFIDELLNVHENIDPLSTEGKPALVKTHQDTTAVMDSLGLCNWPLMGIKFKNLIPMINSALGTAYKAEDLLAIGERVWNLERIFNQKTGMNGSYDTLPDRFINEPVTEGPAEGQVSKVKEMLPEYYKLRGWSEKGEPLPETLKSLGLEE